MITDQAVEFAIEELAAILSLDRECFKYEIQDESTTVLLIIDATRYISAGKKIPEDEISLILNSAFPDVTPDITWAVQFEVNGMDYQSLADLRLE